MSNHSKAVKTATPERGKRAVVNQSFRETAKAIGGALARKEKERLSTLGLYSLKVEESPFGLPFCSVNDRFALLASKEMLPIANVYKVGEFCLLNGKVRSFSRPVLVLDNKVD